MMQSDLYQYNTNTLTLSVSKISKDFTSTISWTYWLIFTEMSITDLDRSHNAHDDFVRGVVKGIVPIRVVKIATDQLISAAVPGGTFISYISGLRLPANNAVNNLAIYILLKHFPQLKWIQMRTHAYQVLCDVLETIRDHVGDVLIFPPMWSKHIFHMENLLPALNLKGIIFGIDPIPSDSAAGRYATGVAFCFDGNGVRPTTSSTIGLNNTYYLDVDVLDMTAVDAYFETHKLMLVNFIRMIRQQASNTDVVAGSRNIFAPAWTKYHLELLKHKDAVPVLVFQNEDSRFTFDRYNAYPAICNLFPSFFQDFEDVLTLLSNRQPPPRYCSHPSYSEPSSSAPAHCLLAPNAVYRNLPAGTAAGCVDASVTTFLDFMTDIQAVDACICRCNTCRTVQRDQAIAANDEAQEAENAAVEAGREARVARNATLASKKRIVALLDELREELEALDESATNAKTENRAAQTAAKLAADAATKAERASYLAARYVRTHIVLGAIAQTAHDKAVAARACANTAQQEADDTAEDETKARQFAKAGLKAYTDFDVKQLTKNLAKM